MNTQTNNALVNPMCVTPIALALLLSACSPNVPDGSSSGEITFMTRERDVAIVVRGDLAIALTRAFADCKQARGDRVDRLYGRPWGIFVQGTATLAWSEDRVFGLVEGKKGYWSKRIPELSTIAATYKHVSAENQSEMDRNRWELVFRAVKAKDP